jgi:N-acetylglucosaminyldiphosphoundecaprenol N-acetyl-beta-D-mannosaminyltransferase
MQNSSIYILGVRIDVYKIEEINSLIVEYAKKETKKPLIIFKPYVEFLSLAGKNDDVKKLLNSSDINIADSSAIQWAASYLYGKPNIGSNIISTYFSLIFRLQSEKWRQQIVPQRMAGVDQTLPLLRLASKNNLKIGILGGPKDTLATQKELEKRFKNIKVNIWSGFYEESSESELVYDIASKNLDVLFCAMGFPKQEKFIVKHQNKLNAKVLIGEGGSFDYDQLGGSIKRAPAWMRKLSLEWLWRLIIQPKRIRRQLAIPNFIKQVRKEKRSQK